MLKRLLKFFKGGEEPPAPEHGGSYLDFLLEQARPGVQGELAACPEHDPLLLVIVQLLNVSMRGSWSQRIERPLRDSFSPLPAPAAAPQLFAEDSDAEEVDESEVMEDEEVDATSRLDMTPVEEDTSPRAALPEGVLAGDDMVDGTQEIDPEIIAKAAAKAPPPPPAFQRPLAETTQDGLDAVSSVVEEVDPLPRADRKEVLQAGRVFLGMLIENDRLPPDLHLGLEETALARDLLVGYFVGASQYEVKAQKLLKIVEQKFSEGLFSQARILLQLFQTDRETRMRNDRNIFYEDMIQRLGIRRRHTVSPELAERYQLLLKEISAEPSEEEILLLLRWLSQHIFIKLHLFVRPRAQVETWRKVTSASTLQQVTEHFLRYLPPRRWRAPLDITDRGLAQQLRDHLSPETLSIYVVNHLKACYFVLRAVGDTGLEGYLDTFFNWTRTALDYDATALCPELYRRSMSDGDAMSVIFQDIYDRSMRTQAEERLRAVDDAAIRAALRGVVAHLRLCDINELPPGNYDLGALIFDQVMGVKYPSPEFAFKVHRLT
jgi:hypothetical protein